LGWGKKLTTHLGHWIQPQLQMMQAGLLVDIEKPLSNFKLDTAFTVQQETLGILGGSGSGKSMTLRCIAGVDTPAKGRIVLNGRSLFDADKNINLPSITWKKLIEFVKN
jgi:ABC-type sulfate/molybdate transport systems ATPase subunit